MSTVMAAFSLWNHPAGPKTIHFWAPTFKWGLTIANVVDFSKPHESISYPQQIALAASGLIWARYSTIITPKNWNLFGVSLGMSATGIGQLARKAWHDYYSEKNTTKAEE
ncbi:mitochondrial pyruvate carrier 3-like [Salvia splendens]|uniref:mitochondrial pyruvate carrier 3-like n=1 Tax=Salvia splendens TaxID=180675 RepID=UPI001C266F6C|nr:mitochondrial pyruvate carrier 3-like [Salvia splendens]